MVYTKHGPKQSGRKGQYVGHRWYDDIVVLPDEERVMPVTVAHDVIKTHRYGCQCAACRQYPNDLKRTLKRKKGTLMYGW